MGTVRIGAGQSSAPIRTLRSWCSRPAPGQEQVHSYPLTAFSKLFRSEVDWDYLTEPQKQLDGREIYWPRGKMLGGSSSMNAMMWVRGFADPGEWGALAGEGWDFAHVSKYFAKIEAGRLSFRRSAAAEFDRGLDEGRAGMRIRHRVPIAMRRKGSARRS